jgi:RNA polymerase sigma-70 factor, ECF subfamily
MERRPSPPTPPTDSRPASIDQDELVEALRAGDENAYVGFVRLHGPSMLRIARLYVGSKSVAEEVVQETWLAVFTGIGRFESRSSLRTWLFKILTNRAMARATKEGRSVPFSTMSSQEVGADEPSVDLDRFRGPEQRWAHYWTSSPAHWADLPEARLLSQETISMVERATASLPPAQRAVVILRDVAGWSSQEVCDVLEITATNQRVLLHRGRTKVRKDLERHLAT